MKKAGLIIGGVSLLVLAALLLIPNDEAAAPDTSTEQSSSEQTEGRSQLQIAQVNTQIRSDMGKLTAGLINYAAENNGQYPDSTTEIVAFEAEYVEDDLVHPVTDKRYTTNPENSDGELVEYAVGQCDEANENIIPGSSRSRALRIELIDGDFYCIDT